MATLLVVDDEPPIWRLFREMLQEHAVSLVTAGSASEGLEAFQRCHPQAVVLDLELPDGSGLTLFDQLHAQNPHTPVIFLTGHGTTETAIEAMAQGAYDYVLKPMPIQPLRELVLQALEVGRTCHAPEEATRERHEPLRDQLIGRTAAMQEVYKSIGRVAPQSATVLILGESGTGKELVARAIHQHSRRVGGPFVAVNCAAIPETLLESELFGHEKGAFTGADRRHLGKFEQCNGGTLFLDEIGDMTPLTQAKILRVLQDQQFTRLGGNELIQTEVRVIAATNRDLAEMVTRGQFRRDLYYRLHVYSLRLPPLRDRLDDLPLLIEHFLRHFRRTMEREVQGLAPTVLDRLRQHSWPGNVRELQSALEHALLRAIGPQLLPEHFTEALGAPSVALSPSNGNLELDRFVLDRLNTGTQNLYAEWQELAERRLFAQVLQHTNGNLTLAARILGIHRATLRARLSAMSTTVAELLPIAETT